MKSLTITMDEKTKSIDYKIEGLDMIEVFGMLKNAERTFTNDMNMREAVAMQKAVQEQALVNSIMSGSKVQ